MYQALYRKYRPKNFDEVFGQDVVIKTLRNSIVNNKINHAYLFSGPRGCGKTSIAKIFARMVNCQNLENGNICGKCVCCTQNNDQNMDIIEMDAASNNGVDEIREINNKVNLAPSLGKYKIYIIDEVHMLTIGAFNALLKTLEEPPTHVIFILATTDPHKVPITILSRCQRFDFKKISEEKIFQRLKYICDTENIAIDDEAIAEISRNGDGSLRDAISILDQVIAYTSENITLKDVHDVNGTVSQDDIAKLFESLIKNNLNDIFIKITDYNNTGKSIIKITEEIIIFLRNLILAHTNPEILENKLDIYENLKKQLSIDDMLEYIKIMNQTLLDMKKFSNPKMLLELGFIKIMNSRRMFDTNTVEKKDYQSIPQINIQKETIVKEENQKSEIKNSTSKSSEFSKLELKPENIENNSPNIVTKPEEIKIKTSINQKSYDELDKFIDRRVSNTLSKFSKPLTVEMKKSLERIMDYLMDEKYGRYAEIISDGELKAVSDEYAIFAYTTDHLAYQFNESLENIELLVNEILKKQYKLVAVDNDKWNIIKENFNLKKQKYEYQQEENNISDILKKINGQTDDDMESMFGNILEYN